MWTTRKQDMSQLLLRQVETLCLDQQKSRLVAPNKSVRSFKHGAARQGHHNFHAFLVLRFARVPKDLRDWLSRGKGRCRGISSAHHDMRGFS